MSVRLDKVIQPKNNTRHGQKDIFSKTEREQLFESAKSSYISQVYPLLSSGLPSITVNGLAED